MKLQAIHDWLTQRTGHALNGDEDLMRGDAERELSCVAVCWMPSAVNIRRAAELGADLLICHEALTHPYPGPGQRPEDAPGWAINRERLDLLDAHGMTVTRLHGTLDELYIYDDFAEQLGLSEGRLLARGEGYADRVFEVEPTTFGAMVERIKQATGLSAMRCTPTPHDHPVRVIGMPWGGLGLFVNVGYVQGLIQLAASAGKRIDLLIAGETDNYGMRFATEQGITVIETSHEVSEDRGLVRFCDDLRQRFPALTVHWLDDPCVWEIR